MKVLSPFLSPFGEVYCSLHQLNWIFLCDDEWCWRSELKVQCCCIVEHSLLVSGLQHSKIGFISWFLYDLSQPKKDIQHPLSLTIILRSNSRGSLDDVDHDSSVILTRAVLSWASFLDLWNYWRSVDEMLCLHVENLHLVGVEGNEILRPPLMRTKDKKKQQNCHERGAWRQEVGI